MKIILFFSLFLVTSCLKDDFDYFPLNNGKIWNYNVTINPGVEDKVIYKKTNFTLNKQNLKIIETNEEKQVYPIIREDNSIYYYSKNEDGIVREGMQHKNNYPILFEDEKKYVLKFPIEIGTNWESISKTFLILRRYAYFDYRATTNFNIKYEITSLNQTVSVPAGKFKDCIKITGTGETTFIGDREIGTIDISIKTDEWYAPNVGLIKSVRLVKTNSDLFGTSKMTQVLDDYK